VIAPLAAAAALLLVAPPASGPAPTPASASNPARTAPAAEPPELAEVRARIRTLEDQLRKVLQQQADLSQQRRQLEGELELARLRVRESEVALQQVRGAETAAIAAAETAQKDLTAAADRLRTQITVLAVLGRAGLTPLIYHAVLGGEDIQHRVTVLRTLVRDQEAHRVEMERLAETRATALANLSQRRQQSEEASSTVQERRNELDRTRTRVVAQLAELERQRRASAVALAHARA